EDTSGIDAADGGRVRRQVLHGIELRGRSRRRIAEVHIGQGELAAAKSAARASRSPAAGRAATTGPIVRIEARSAGPVAGSPATAISGIARIIGAKFVLRRVGILRPSSDLIVAGASLLVVAHQEVGAQGGARAEHHDRDDDPNNQPRAAGGRLLLAE